MIRVLVVEDEAALRVDLVDYLDMRGFEARGIGCAHDWPEAVADFPPDIAILDVGLPDGNGFALADDARRTLNCGVIMLTAHGDPENRIRGFQSGADIYLVKHSTLQEVEAATLALFRRLQKAEPPAAQVAEQPVCWVLDRAAWTLVAPDGAAASLTATERAFLTVLIAKGGEPCTRAELTEILSRPQARFDDRHLDAVVSRLRKKIAGVTEAEGPIRSAYGVGYAFGAPARVQGD